MTKQNMNGDKGEQAAGAMPDEVAAAGPEVALGSEDVAREAPRRLHGGFTRVQTTPPYWRLGRGVARAQLDRSIADIDRLLDTAALCDDAETAATLVAAAASLGFRAVAFHLRSERVALSVLEEALRLEPAAGEALATELVNVLKSEYADRYEQAGSGS